MRSGTLVSLGVTALLLIGAVEAVVRTNPISHRPQPVGEASPADTEGASVDATPVLQPRSVDIGDDVFGVRMVEALDGRIVLGDKSLGLLFYDRAEDGSLRRVAECTPPGEPMSAALGEGFVLAAGSWGGITTIEVGRDDACTIAGYWQTSALSRAIASVGEYALVADWNAGVQVLDVGDPGAPALVATVPTPGHASDVVLDGDTAYVADFEGGVQLIDVARPQDARIISVFEGPAAVSVVVGEGRLYVADEQLGLLILDVSDPRSPVLLGRLATSGPAHALALDGDTVYVADLTGGLAAVDVSDPFVPRVTAYGSVQGTIHDIALVGSTLYVADDGLQAIDISEPPSRVPWGGDR